MALVVAVMQDPVLRLALRIERALVRHVGGVAAGVSAVASSNELVSAPTMEAIFMVFLPLRPVMLRAANVRARRLLPNRQNDAFAAP